uniref:BZIP domain-containing protein n=1 Tax=Echinostoma caproni TaxID=27848 RepID=A0A183AH45_9TREM
LRLFRFRNSSNKAVTSLLFQNIVKPLREMWLSTPHCPNPEWQADKQCRGRHNHRFPDRFPFTRFSEAARECRRKKKEYVKCLEARVSLLESQNQQLIEELQKVKALCFNELCGLGLNSSTAACAAAVLAAVTSGPGTYSAAGAPTVSNVKSSDRMSDVPGHLSDQLSPNTSAVSLDNSHGSTTHLNSVVRPHRTRRQSILASSRITPIPGNGSGGAGNSNGGPQSYQTLCDSTQSGRSYLHEDVDVKPSNPSPSMTSHTPLPADLATERISPASGGTVYDSGSVDTNDPYRTRSHIPINHQPPHSRRVDPYQQQHSPTKTSTLISPYASCSSTSSSTTTTASTDGGYYHHPHYAAKRAYRNMAVANPDVKPNFLSGQQQPEDSIGESIECRPKSTRASNSVAGAAVILAAAAAAMVAESESSDPRISV